MPWLNPSWLGTMREGWHLGPITSQGRPRYVGASDRRALALLDLLFPAVNRGVSASYAERWRPPGRGMRRRARRRIPGGGRLESSPGPGRGSGRAPRSWNQQKVATQARVVLKERSRHCGFPRGGGIAGIAWTQPSSSCPASGVETPAGSERRAAKASSAAPTMRRSGPSFGREITTSLHGTARASCETT